MNTKNIMVVSKIGLVLILLTACSAIAPAPVPTPTAVVMPSTGIQYHFVTNSLQLPATQAQTQAFALNIDGDPQQKLDNKFGDMFTLLMSAAPGLNLQSTLDQAVNAGQLVSLHAVQANDPLNDPSVSWTILQGQAAGSAPRFDGTDTFMTASDVSIASPVIGSLVTGHFVGASGKAGVQIFLLGQTVKVDLIGVRLEADFGVNGCVNGKLGGGVTVAEFKNKLLPAIAEGLNQIITADATATKILSQSFDANNDGTITSQELEGNPLLMIAISPDLDLLDASGIYNPGQDGVKDSYSVGFGFSCIPASFTMPETVLVP